MLTFLQFCKDNKWRPNAVGDFATDVVADKHRPRQNFSQPFSTFGFRWLCYLRENSACEGALNGFQRAFSEYLQELRDTGEDVPDVVIYNEDDEPLGVLW